MERPKFMRRKEHTESPLQFRVNNEWNQSNPNLRVDLRGEELAGLAKRDLDFTDEVIRRIAITLTDEVAGRDCTKHLTMSKPGGDININIPIQHGLLSGIDWAERRRSQAQFYRGLVQNVAGTVEDGDASYDEVSERITHQKKVIILHLLTHLVEANLKVDNEVIEHEAKKKSRVVDAGIAASVPLAIATAASRTATGLVVSSTLGYFALRLSARKAGIVRKMNEMRVLEQDAAKINSAIEKINDNQPEDWTATVSIDEIRD